MNKKKVDEVSLFGSAGYCSLLAKLVVGRDERMLQLKMQPLDALLFHRRWLSCDIRVVAERRQR